MWKVERIYTAISFSPYINFNEPSLQKTIKTCETIKILKLTTRKMARKKKRRRLKGLKFEGTQISTRINSILSIVYCLFIFIGII